MGMVLMTVMKKEDGNIEDLEKIIQYPTIKDLLLHTAGFSYNFLADPVGKEYDKLKLFNSSVTTLEEEIKILAKVPLLFQPKKSWRYSVSMDVLARIIEVVRGDSLQNILYQRIFSPLKMKDTGDELGDALSGLIETKYNVLTITATYSF